jgi:hypothetical protein
MRVSHIWGSDKGAGTGGERPAIRQCGTNTETSNDTNTTLYQSEATMPAVDLLELTARLTDRDIAILRTLRTHRLATTAQLRRWHFAEEFASQSGATRATQRVLGRLEGHRLVNRLTQRVGGAMAGSDSLVWQLDVVGDRLLSVKDGESRRRYIEPGRAFMTHTVAVTELATRLHEAERVGSIDGVRLDAEPTNWQRFLGPHGQAQILKPDLTAIVTVGAFEDHWFLERDLATEAPSIVVRQARIYQRYVSTGSYQGEHGVFPAVLWIVPEHTRRQAVERALRAAADLTPGIHRVVDLEGFVPAVLAGSDPANGP